MSCTIFDLKQMDKRKMLERIQKTLANFPILEEIYDMDFLNKLATHPHSGNYLLWLLVSKHEFTELTWQSISADLEILRCCDSIRKFKYKLRAQKQPAFESYVTELELAAHYKSLGYSLKLEPIDGVDFVVRTENLHILFQVKYLYLTDEIQKRDIQSRLHERLEHVKEPLIFSLEFIGKIEEKDLKAIENNVRSTLRRILNEGIPLPFTFQYPNIGNAILKVTVLKKSPREYGYLGTTGGVATYSTVEITKNVRKKIVKKITKLPKDAMNVLVLSATMHPIDDEIIEDALFGDYAVRINLKDNSTTPIIKGDCIFAINKNRRISAIIFYRKIFSGLSRFRYQQIVYHHPLPHKEIPKEFFAEKGVRQFVPSRNEKGISMVVFDS